MQDRDIWKLREVIKTRLNLEMANSPEIVAIALRLKPEIICLVPERRQEVTTEGGLDVVSQEKALTETRKKMSDAGIEVSLFIAPATSQIEAAKRVGAEFVELHTGAFAESFFERFSETPSSCEMKGTSQKKASSPEFRPGDLPELDRLIAGAKHAHSLGLKVNAGHGLNYENLGLLHQKLKAIPFISQITHEQPPHKHTKGNGEVISMCPRL